MSVSSRSSSSSSNSSWSSKGSRTSSKWTSSSTKTRERKLPNTPAVNSLIWFSGRDPRKVKGVKVYETLWERDYYDDSRSSRSGWSTGTQTKKEYEVYFVESPYVRADWYSNSNGSTSRGWKTSNSSSGRSSGQSGRNKPVDPWTRRNRAPQQHHRQYDDDDSSSEGSDDSGGHEYGMPVPAPPPMMGGPMAGMPPDARMGPPGMGMPMRPPGMDGPPGPPPPPPPPGAFRPSGPPGGGPHGGFRGPMGGPPGPPPPPPPPPSGPPGGGEPEFFKLN